MTTQTDTQPILDILLNQAISRKRLFMTMMKRFTYKSRSRLDCRELIKAESETIEILEKMRDER